MTPVALQQVDGDIQFVDYLELREMWILRCGGALPQIYVFFQESNSNFLIHIGFLFLIFCKKRSFAEEPSKSGSVAQSAPV